MSTVENLELRFFKLFAEKTRSVFWVRDTKCNKQLYVSPAYEKIWGRNIQALYNNPDSWIDTLVPEDRPAHTANQRIQSLKEKGEDIEYEDRYRVRHPDGRIIWVKDTSFPIYDESNQFIGFAGIAEDVTKDMLHEEQIQDAKMIAEAANRAKSDFLAMMSHELRTPLNAILGMAQIFRLKGVPEEFEECVSVITQAGNNLLSLVNDILDFAKLDVGTLSFSSEAFDLHALISQVVFSLAHQAKEKDLQLNFNFNEKAPKLVVGDAKRVRQVLVNLINNAIKFTIQGSVAVDIDCLEQDGQRGLFQVIVSDTGIGIKSDKLQFIFEKFSQIDSIYHRKHDGTGLGLAISKELVEKMGGTINVCSELGQGSQFSFILPLQLHIPTLEDSLRSQSRFEMLNSQSKAKMTFNLKVLLVEDNAINQRITTIMLEDAGCRVTIADSGRDALEKLIEEKDYDIVFMDIGLPDMSGFDVVSAIRQQAGLEKIPVIAVTAHILERDKQQCYAAGMDMIITKPISYDELMAVLGYWTEA